MKWAGHYSMCVFMRGLCGVSDGGWVAVEELLGWSSGSGGGGASKLCPRNKGHSSPLCPVAWSAEPGS